MINTSNTASCCKEQYRQTLTTGNTYVISVFKKELLISFIIKVEKTPLRNVTLKMIFYFIQSLEFYPNNLTKARTRNSINFGVFGLGIEVDFSFALKANPFTRRFNSFQNPCWIFRIDFLVIFADHKFPPIFNHVLKSDIIELVFLLDNGHLVVSPDEVQFCCNGKLFEGK